MSLIGKIFTYGLLTPALFINSWESYMTKAKSKPRRRSAAVKVRAAGRSASAPKKRVSRNARSVAAQRAATKRALIRAGRTALALAKQSTRNATNAGRGALARAARSAADGLQHAAKGVGDAGASALQSVADRVQPTAPR
jgi:hypothetical protein